MSQVSAADLKNGTISAKLKDIRILLVAPSLAIMGGQAVQADLLYKNFKKENVDIGFLPVNPIPWGPLKYLTKIKYVRTLIVSIFYLCSLLWNVRNYDVIHIFSASYFSFILAPTPALLISKLYKKKSILNYRSGEAEDHFTRGGKLVASILKLADKIVTPSGFLVDVFAKFSFQAESVYNISDVSMFKFKKRVILKPKIIVARNLEELYDVGTSLRAFKIVKEKYPEASITIVGDGSARNHLHNLVAEMNLEDVTFTGRVERKEMPELFDNADIFLNSSIIDNMPVAIVEAFYNGLPVVTTDAGGIPYIVKDHDNGLLVPMKDHQALANGVMELLENKELSQRVLNSGRKWAEDCSWDNVKIKWAEIYYNLNKAHEEN